MWVSRTAQRRIGQGAGKFRWTIGAVLTAVFALASLFGNAKGNRSSKETGGVESSRPPTLARKTVELSSEFDFDSQPVEPRKEEPLSQMELLVPGSQSEPDATRSLAERAPVTAFAQIGNGGPGGLQPPGGGNRPGGGGAGNGNQFPGGGSQFGGTGPGAGGVCIATRIQFEANVTAGLSNRYEKAVRQRPTNGSFFSD